jgi:hypothetical protein
LPTFRILLDECIDRRLSKQIPGHQVKTTPEMGWAGFDSGELLAKAEKDFDIFITVDRNLTFSKIFLSSTLPFWFCASTQTVCRI